MESRTTKTSPELCGCRSVTIAATASGEELQPWKHMSQYRIWTGGCSLGALCCRSVPPRNISASYQPCDVVLWYACAQNAVSQLRPQIHHQATPSKTRCQDSKAACWVWVTHCWMFHPQWTRRSWTSIRYCPQTSAGRSRRFGHSLNSSSAESTALCLFTDTCCYTATMSAINVCLLASEACYLLTLTFLLLFPTTAAVEQPDPRRGAARAHVQGTYCLHVASTQYI